MRKYLSRRMKVLKLLEVAEDYISGQELSERLDVSRTTIWKYINYFREAGYEIESSSRLGYKLVAASDILLPEKIKLKLTTNQIGTDIFHYDQVASTNQVAKEKVKSSLESGTAIIAEQQTGGRGRLGRKFVSPRGGIWTSIILFPNLKPVLATRATYLAALAVAETIVEIVDLQPQIKWPNDILLSGSKISGILTEMSAELDRVNHLILGIGINANFTLEQVPPDLQEKVTTLYTELGARINRINFICKLFERLEELYPLLHKFDELIAQWKKYSVTLGQKVEVIEGEERYVGQAVDIDKDGGLILTVNNEQRKVYSGQVSLVY